MDKLRADCDVQRQAAKEVRTAGCSLPVGLSSTPSSRAQPHKIVLAGAQASLPVHQTPAACQ